MTGHSDSNARKVPSTGAFVTFFKSLFGAGLLALPNVLGRVGLSLGIIIYFLVALGCALSCYLLLRAREVTAQYLLSNLDERPNSSENNTNDTWDDEDGRSALPKAKPQPHPHHLVTYGDLADVLLGHAMASITRWTIISLNILFTAGLVIVICENLSDLAPDDASVAAARRAIGICLFPVVSALLQIPWLQDMWHISALGLAVYTIGVMGSTLFSAIWTISSGGAGESGRRMPDDVWAIKWDGVRSFVGSAVYALEGINLALPTVHSMQHPSDAVEVVCSGVMLYGCLTVAFAAVGYAGGLGGGPGTGKSPEDCDVVTKCITPQSLQWTIQIALSIAMLLSLPVMLYPSTEMLEVILTDRREEKASTSKDSGEVTLVELKRKDDVSGPPKRHGSQELLINAIEDATKKNYCEVAYGTVNDGFASDPHEFSQDKSWKLRVFLAFLTVAMGTFTKSFTYFSGFVGAVGLSFAGFILPPLLYLRAMQLANFPIPLHMNFLMAFIALFGLYNMVVGGATSFVELIDSF